MMQSQHEIELNTAKKRQQAIIKEHLEKKSLRNEANLKAQKTVEDLFEAIINGYVLAVERIANAENINKFPDENSIRYKKFKKMTPLQALANCIMKANDSTMISKYFRILYILLNKGADATRLSDLDVFVMDLLCPFILHKDQLIKAKYPNKSHSPSKQKNLTHAAEIFDGFNFAISRLQHLGFRVDMTQETFEHNLYDKEEDFVINLNTWDRSTDGRIKMGVKLGRIYFEYQPGGKASFNAKIYLIDSCGRKLSLMQKIKGMRYSGLEFQAFVPFALDSFNSSQTCVGKSSTFSYQHARLVYESAKIYKDNLIQLCLNKPCAPFYIVIPDIRINAEQPVLKQGRIFRNNNELKGFIDTELCQTVQIFKIIDNTFILADEFKISEENPLNLNQFACIEYAKIDANKDNIKTIQPHQLEFIDAGLKDHAYKSRRETLTSTLSSFNEDIQALQKNIHRLPDEFICPLSGEQMQDPVSTIYGGTYEEEWLSAWFKMQKERGLAYTDPLSGEKLPTPLTIIKNKNLQEAILFWERTKDIEVEKLNFLKKRAHNPAEPNTPQSALPSYEELPQAYCCSISSKLMSDPVMTIEGTSYERSAISCYPALLQKDKEFPLLGKLIPNYSLKQSIDNWQARKKQIEEKRDQAQRISDRSQKNLHSQEAVKETGKEKEKEKEKENNDYRHLAAKRKAIRTMGVPTHTSVASLIKAQEAKISGTPPMSQHRTIPQEIGTHGQVKQRAHQLTVLIHCKDNKSRDTKSGDNKSGDNKSRDNNPFTIDNLCIEYQSIINGCLKMMQISGIEEMCAVINKKEGDYSILLAQLSMIAAQKLEGTKKISAPGFTMRSFLGTNASHQDISKQFLHMLANVKDLISSPHPIRLKEELFKLFDFVLDETRQDEQIKNIYQSHFFAQYPSYEEHRRTKQLEQITTKRM